MTKCIRKLEALYNEHRILDRAQVLVERIITTNNDGLRDILFQKFDFGFIFFCLLFTSLKVQLCGRK